MNLSLALAAADECTTADLSALDADEMRLLQALPRSTPGLALHIDSLTDFDWQRLSSALGKVRVADAPSTQPTGDNGVQDFDAPTSIHTGVSV